MSGNRDYCSVFIGYVQCKITDNLINVLGVCLESFSKVNKIKLN